SSPASVPGASGYNVHVATASGQEVLQNGAMPLAIGTNWTEPTSGLLSGTAAPRITSDQEVLQNGDPIALGTNWTEPVSGLVSGRAIPRSNGIGDGNRTQQTLYPTGTPTPTGNPPADIRVNLYSYDGRDQLVAEKDGVLLSSTAPYPYFPNPAG